MRAIDADMCEPYFYEHLDDNAMAGAMNAINEMPTIEPKRKKGKWVPLISTSDGKHHEWCGYQCSICGERTLRLMQHNFCPNCGSDMRV